MMPSAEVTTARTAAFPGKDPGGLVQEGRHVEVVETITDAQPLTHVGLSQFDLGSPEGRVAATRAALGALSRLPVEEQTAAAGYLASRPGMEPLVVVEIVIDQRQRDAQLDQLRRLQERASGLWVCDNPGGGSIADRTNLRRLQ